MAYALAEEPIDMAQRHVLQTERLVARQRALVERLRSGGHIELIPQARALLINLRTSVIVARKDLARLLAISSAALR